MSSSPIIGRDLTNNEIKSEQVKNQVLVFVFILISCLVVFLIILVSKTTRVYFCLNKLTILNSNQINQKSLIDLGVKHSKNYNTEKLRDFFVASAYLPYVCYYHKFDYVSLEVFRDILKYGPRFVELQIFNSGYGKDVEPVISIGEEKGEWKYTLNSINLKEFLKVIAAKVFSPDLKVHKDPFILFLNLKVNRNIRCLNKIHRYIYDILGQFLLDTKYSYNSKDDNVKFRDITIEECYQKIIIFSTSGFEESNLEELVNYSTVSNYTLKNFKNQYRMLYIKNNDILDNEDDLEENTINHKIKIKDLQDYNKCSFTIVSPQNYNDGIFEGISPINHETGKGFESGSQFIMINYQKIDTNMSNYIYVFKDSSFILKDDTLKSNDNNQCNKYFSGEIKEFKDRNQSELNYIYTKK